MSTSKRAWIVCCIASLFYAYIMALGVSPSIMVKPLLATFHIDMLHFSNLSAFFFYATLIMQIPAAVILERVDIKKAITVAFLVGLVGNFLFVITHYVLLAEIGRVLAGFANAFAFVGVLRLMSTWLPEEKMGAASALVMSFGVFGAILANLVLPQFVISKNWQFVMWLIFAFGVVGFGLMLWLTEEGPIHINASTPSWRWQVIWGQFKRSILNPQILLAGMLAALFYLPIGVFASLWGPYYLQKVCGLSYDFSTKANALIFFGMVIAGPAIAFLSEKAGVRKPFLLGCLLLGLISMLLVFYVSLSIVLLLAVLLLVGVCSGAEGLSYTFAEEVDPGASLSMVFAIANLLCSLGVAVFQSLVGVLFAWRKTHLLEMHIAIHLPSLLKFSISCVPVAFIIGILLSFKLKETHVQGGS
tara:strand:- start:6398 stop:7645 length:1248 start_codon:yes stop_codon:yes gene_type:complete